MKMKVQSYREYEGFLHEVRTRYKVVGRTFGLLPFEAGPFQTEEEANAVADFLNQNGEQ